MSFAHLQGRSVVAAAKPKRQQADVMLQQWILNKASSTHISPSSPTPLSSPMALAKPSFSAPSPPPPPPRDAEEKEQLRDGGESAGEAEVDDDVLLVSLSRELPLLSDDSPQQQRRQAMQRIARSLRAGNEAADFVSSPSAAPLPVHPATVPTLVSLLLKPLLRRLTDEVERCRALSSSVLLQLLRDASLPTLLSSLPFLLPTLCYRLQTRDLTPASLSYTASNQHTHFPLLPSSTAEPSEELRLSLFHLVALVVRALSSHPSDASLPLFLPDLLAVLAQGLVDRVAGIKVLCSAQLVSLLRSHPQALRPSSTVLCRVATSNALSGQQRVRLATLDVLRLLVPLGAAEHIRDLAAFRERNMIDLHGFYHGEARVNYLARLVQDDKAEVRQALYRCVGDWLESMTEAADYETLLMPYLLSGLHDSWDANRSICLLHLQRLGAAFEADRAEELEDARVYGTQAEAISRPLLRDLPTLQLSCFPFHSRPSLGLRLRLRPFIDRLLPALLSELRDWQRAVQRDSLLLLRTLLFVGEEWVGAEWMREVVEVGLKVGRGAEWAEIPALVGRYGGGEVMRELARARENERGAAVVDAIPALVRGMPPAVLAERVDAFEQWMEEDRRQAGVDAATIARQLAAYQHLTAVHFPTDREDVTARLREGLRGLWLCAEKRRELSDVKALVQPLAALLKSTGV